MHRVNYILILLTLTNTVFGQKEKDSTFYIGANLFPIISTQVGGFFEKDMTANLTFHTGLGYVFNGPGSFYKIGTEIDLEKSSGGYLTVGLNWHMKNKRVTPLVGLRLVNSVSHETGYDEPIQIDTVLTQPEYFTSNGYSFGVAGVLGLSISLSKKISCDLGLQRGYLIKNGLCDFHSFAPGMGRNWDPQRGQMILQIKYKFGK